MGVQILQDEPTESMVHACKGKWHVCTWTYQFRHLVWSYHVAISVEHCDSAHQALPEAVLVLFAGKIETKLP